MKPILGSIVALVTPMHDDGSVDYPGLRGLIDWHIAEGTDCIGVVGTTGESPTVSVEEHCEIIRVTVQHAAGRVPVMAGAGANSTREAITLTKFSKEVGADCSLQVVPYYNKPSQEGIYQHFKAIAEAVDLPVVLYNVPGRTGCDLLPETVAELVAHPSIVGIKEARAEPERMAALLALRSPGFAVLSGADPTACRAMLAGADGLISVGSNALPRAFSRLCDLSRSGERGTAEAWDLQLQPFYPFLGVESNPIPVKALLQGMGFGAGLRLPLLSLSLRHQAEAERLVAAALALEEHSSHDTVAA